MQITNFDAAYTWAGTATASGTVAIDSSTGLVTVTGVTAGTSSTATITTIKANSVGGSATVTAISGSNQAPVNSVPSAQMVSTGQPLAFTAYRGNPLSISDPDAGTSNVQVTLSVGKGTLDLINRNPGNKLTYTVGDGIADATMTITGTIADINTALSWLSYQPVAERYFQWRISAGGNDHWYEYVSTGAIWTAANATASTVGGYLATLTSSGESDFVNAFLPTNVETWVGGYQDRSGLTFSEPLSGWKWANGETWSYANWGSGQPDNTSGVEDYLTTNLSGSLKWNDRPGTYSTSYVIEYESDPRPARHLDATLTITTNDLGNVGTGGAKSDTDTVAITVNPVASFAASPSYQTLPAVLDTSFNSTGKQVLSITAGIDIIYDMKVLSDGKIVAVGAVNDRFGILRFNADMTLDATFGTGGGTQTDFGAGVHARSFTIDSAGRFILVGGNRVARYTALGILDTTFGTSGSTTNANMNPAYAVALQPDGKIVTLGRDSDVYRVARFTAAGTLDAEWNIDAGGSGSGYGGDYGRGLVVRDDGDILLTGKTYYYSGGTKDGFGVVRISSTGTVEQDVAYDLGTGDFVNSSLALPDGKLLLVGISNGDLTISRHSFSGAIDTSFGTAGSVKIPVLNSTDEGFRATLAADGKILVTGFANNGVDQDLVVVRLSYDGVLDTSFGVGGKTSVSLGSNDYGYAIASLANGKILVAGRSNNDIALVRLLGDSDQSAAG